MLQILFFFSNFAEEMPFSFTLLHLAAVFEDG